MADQTIRVTNMPDGGSPERVAYDLYVGIRSYIAPSAGSDLKTIAKRHLDLFVACRTAVRTGDVKVDDLT